MKLHFIHNIVLKTQIIQYFKITEYVTIDHVIQNVSTDQRSCLPIESNKLNS